VGALMDNHMKNATWVIVLSTIAIFTPHAIANEADIEIIVDAKGNSSIDEPSTLYSTVSAKQIEESGSQTINEVFETILNLPIVGDSVGTGALGMPDLGGFGETARANTLILLNGYPLNNPTLETPNISTIPLESISRIDVFSQGSSTLFGNGAVGGVVNIITLPTKLKNQSKTKISVGSFGYINTSASVTRVLAKDLSLNLVGNLSSKDGYRHHTDVKNSFGSVNLVKILNRGTLEFSQTSGLQERQDAGAASLSAIATDRKAAGRETDLDLRSSITNLAYTYNSDESRYAAHLNHRQSAQEGTDTNSTTQVTKVTSLNLNRSALDGKRISGIDITSSTYDSPWSAEDRYQQTFDVFTKSNVNYDSYEIGLGIRGAYVSDDLSDALKKDQTLVGGEISVTRLIGESAYTLKADRSFRYGNLDENNSATNSEILKPQIADTLSLGIRAGSVRATVFKSWIQDEIIYDNVASLNTNIASSSRTGLQISSSHKLTGATALNTNLRWIDASIDAGNFAGKKVPGVSPIHASASVSHKLDQVTSIKISTIYRSSQYPISDYDNSRSKDNEYTRTDIAYNLDLGKSHLGFGINNLFDADYDSYQYDESWLGGELKRTPAEPRNFRVVFSSDF
jgi:iron complex outermembrane receptor protein